LELLRAPFLSLQYSSEHLHPVNLIPLEIGAMMSVKGNFLQVEAKPLLSTPQKTLGTSLELLTKTQPLNCIFNQQLGGREYNGGQQ